MAGCYRINAKYSQLLPVSHFPLSLASDVQNLSSFYGKSLLPSFPGGLIPASIVSTQCIYLISGLSLAIVPNHMHRVVLHVQYCTGCWEGGVLFFPLNFLCAAVGLAWKSCGNCTVCKGSWCLKHCNQLTSELVFFSTGCLLKEAKGRYFYEEGM